VFRRLCKPTAFHTAQVQQRRGQMIGFEHPTHSSLRRLPLATSELAHGGPCTADRGRTSGHRRLEPNSRTLPSITYVQNDREGHEENCHLELEASDTRLELRTHYHLELLHHDESDCACPCTRDLPRILFDQSCTERLELPMQRAGVGKRNRRFV